MSTDTWQWVAIAVVAFYVVFTDGLNWRAVMALAEREDARHRLLEAAKVDKYPRASHQSEKPAP